MAFSKENAHIAAAAGKKGGLSRKKNNSLYKQKKKLMNSFVDIWERPAPPILIAIVKSNFPDLQMDIPDDINVIDLLILSNQYSVFQKPQYTPNASSLNVFDCFFKHVYGMPAKVEDQPSQQLTVRTLNMVSIDDEKIDDEKDGQDGQDAEDNEGEYCDE